MTFKISTRPRVKTRVKLRFEVDGEMQDHEFGVTFRILPMSRSTEEDMRIEARQVTFLTEAIAGFDDLVDDAGQPEPFTPELVSALLDRPEVRTPLIAAYFEAFQKAAAGN
mgnify:CR=1 FL=1